MTLPKILQKWYELKRLKTQVQQAIFLTYVWAKNGINFFFF